MPKKPVAAAVTDNTASPADFERDLAALEQIVKKLELGQQPLAEALADFECGIRLARQCQQQLQAAEQIVQQLTQEGTVDFALIPDTHGV